MAKLLIIEDDPFVQRFYERLFRLNNYETEIVSDGEEGILKAKLLKPDLILLDIILPKINGLDVLKRLKEDPSTKDFTVVMLTNLSDNEVAKKAAELGANGFIIKSQIPPEKLPEKVHEYIRV